MREDREDKWKRRALLVGVDTGEETDFDRSMEELRSLAEACDMEPVVMMTQKLDTVHKALYVGPGKVKELREAAEEFTVDVIVFDGALSPSQMRNLDSGLEKPVLDRTTLILDIFALRARTREAKLQVETARLQYLLPRLIGAHAALSRQGGASGSLSSKGAGETKLELDRRKIEHRIAMLRKELETVSKERETQRKKRSRTQIPQVALVGYTNAGKSTILNRMVESFGEKTDKTVLEKDMLFATLETSVRSIDTGNKRPFFLADTVGFIHKLPHNLIKAFQSTLEEVKYADLLLQVVDFSDPDFKRQMSVTEKTLGELEASDIPRIVVYNKADRQNDKIPETLPRIMDRQIYMSAVNGTGIKELTQMIEELLYAGNVEADFLIPYENGAAASYLTEHGAVLSREYGEEGIRLRLNCHKKDAEKYQSYRYQEK